MTIPLNDTEKTDARRFLGYQAAGSVASMQSSYRFFQEYGTMEFRLLNASDTELVIIRQYLTQCTSLELDIMNSTTKIGIDTAAVFKRNAYEIRDRQNLLDDWRRRFCGFLGLTPGPSLMGGGYNTAIVM